MDQPSSVPPVISNPPTPPQASGHSTTLLVAVSVLIGLLIGILGFVAWQKASVAPVMPEPSIPAPPSTPSTSTVPEIATTTPPLPATSTTVHTDNTMAQLNVEWKTGTIVVPSDVFGSTIPSNSFSVRSTTNYPGGIDEALPEYKFTYNYYEQGRITDGPYKDHLVYGAKQIDRVVDLGMMDTFEAPAFMNLLVSPDKREVRIVGMANSSIFSQSWPNAIYAPNITLTLSSFPETLTLENEKTIRRANLTVMPDPSPLCGGPAGCIDRLPLARTKDGKSLYQGPTGSLLTQQETKSGCVILYRENGEGMIYESGIPSATRESSSDPAETYPVPLIVGPGQLTWNPAFANTSTFRAHEAGGCGGTICLRVTAPDEVKMEDLMQAGTTDAGDPIYVFKSRNDGRSPHGIIYEVYEAWYDYDAVSGQKPPIGMFLQRIKIPVFLWKDAFGRFVVYKNTTVVPLAECGKPVIYLYPTKTQDVHVKLPSFIDVTVSEPLYPKEGWKVSADPSGKLTLKDGSSVSSLFWEGFGVNYTVPTTGFIVKEGEVESFLKRTLPRYGLNAVETKDFMDFWVPLMTGAPYYRVSFLTTDWSKEVPLHVRPSPHTNIRLFMDWQRLPGSITLPEPTITTPTRTGFTLVEWGGLLR